MKQIKPFWILLLVLLIALFYLPGISKYLKLKQKDRELAEEVVRLQTEIAELQREGHLLKTDLGKLEEAVREELGLVKPGEIVLKVVEEKVPQTKPQESS